MKSPKALQDTWNANRGKLPLCSTLDTNNREGRAKALLAKFEPEKLKEAILKARASSLLLGISDPVFHPPITFDWFLDPSHVIQTLEGAYDNPGVQPPDPGTIGKGVKWELSRDSSGRLSAKRIE